MFLSFPRLSSGAIHLQSGLSSNQDFPVCLALSRVSTDLLQLMVNLATSGYGCPH